MKIYVFSTLRQIKHIHIILCVFPYDKRVYFHKGKCLRGVDIEIKATLTVSDNVVLIKVL